MPRNTGPDFNQAANNGDSQPGQLDSDLTIVIRTDARHATASIKENLVNFLKSSKGAALFNQLARDSEQNVEDFVEAKVHEAYQAWGQKVLKALQENINLQQYKLDSSKAGIQFDLHNAQYLAEEAKKYGTSLAEEANTDTPVFFISLDDMIKGGGPNWGEIAFSRLFVPESEGKTFVQSDYTERPGYKPIDDQITTIREQLATLREQYGIGLPVILLEDNVRHARMLNWVIELMEQSNVFDYSELAGISTCFCCASDTEREAIRHNGKTVPLTVVVDYKDQKVDVITPRDLFFDGYVIELEGEKKRLPAIFMNIGTLFKIEAEKENLFKRCVIEINTEFCRSLEKDFGISLPLSWFATADAISCVTGFTPDTPMTYILEHLNGVTAQDNRPDNEKGCGPCQNLAL